MNQHHQSPQSTIFTMQDITLTQTVISVQALTTGIYLLLWYHITENNNLYIPCAITFCTDCLEDLSFMCISKWCIYICFPVHIPYMCIWYFLSMYYWTFGMEITNWTAYNLFRSLYATCIKSGKIIYLIENRHHMIIVRQLFYSVYVI